MVEDRASFSDVLRVREFCYVWLADAQSIAGDQLARVALSVLVFQRTSSSALTALTYALTFLPALIGGALLTGLADRLPRRDLMIWCDLSRFVLVGVMALPGLPLAVVCALVVPAVLAGSPFSAAENALVSTILDGERYAIATGLRTITGQVAQLLGFALGGVIIAAITPRGGLVIDSLSFAVSAALLAAGVRRRPAADSGAGTGPRAYLRNIVDGARLVARDHRLRTLLGLGWLGAVMVVAEGVAAPYAAQLGGGARATGLLMAAMPAGTALGTYLYMRCLPGELRRKLLGPLAIATPLPMIGCASHPSIGVSIGLWFLSGGLVGYTAQVFAEYARAVPDARRGQAIGIAASGSLAVQGVCVLVGGVVAGMFSPATAVWTAGVFELVLAALLALSWSRVMSRERGRQPAAAGEKV